MEGSATNFNPLAAESFVCAGDTGGTSAESNPLSGLLETRSYISSLLWDHQRPVNPFERWGKRHPFLQSKLEEKTCPESQVYGSERALEGQEFQGLTSLPTSEDSDKLLSPLDRFLEKLSWEEARFPDGEDCNLIKSEVEKLVSQLCDFLSRELKMFKNCCILKTGSVYEGVKIGDPDEFDFMIELPELLKVLEFRQSHLTLVPQVVEFTVSDRDFFDDVLKSADTNNDFISGSKGEDESDDDDKEDTLFQSVLISISEILERELKRLISSSKWEWVTMNSSTGGVIPRIAFSPVLSWKGNEFPELLVSLDLCLAVPLERTVIWQLGSAPFLDAWLEKRGTETTVLKETARSSEHLLIRDNKSCRTSFSLREQAIMKRYSPSDGQNKCFRTLKYLRDKCISKAYSFDDQVLHSKLSTYWLKTVMYYQLDTYPESKDWCNYKLGDRVIEIFSVLLEALRRGKLHSYFIPDYNLLKFTESYQSLQDELQEVVTLLSNIHNGEEEAMEQLQIKIAVRQKENEEMLNAKRWENLIDYFYVYAYNGYDDDMGLETMRKFTQRYFSGKMEIFGSGRGIVLKENGSRVDVDKELEAMYNDQFSYYPM